jgi:hypothetical protein
MSSRRVLERRRIEGQDYEDLSSPNPVVSLSSPRVRAGHQRDRDDWVVRRSALALSEPRSDHLFKINYATGPRRKGLEYRRWARHWRLCRFFRAISIWSPSGAFSHWRRIPFLGTSDRDHTRRHHHDCRAIRCRRSACDHCSDHNVDNLRRLQTDLGYRPGHRSWSFTRFRIGYARANFASGQSIS